MSSTATKRPSRLDVSSPENLRRDLGRLVGDVEGLIQTLDQAYQPRRKRGDKYTAGTVRPRLYFDRTPIVDTRDGDVRLYLPQATTRDAGLEVAFIKQIPTGAVHLQPTDGTLINGYSKVENLTQVGYHNVLWDGSAWWFREPRARVRRHTWAAGTVGLWQFDGDLLDSSGQGNHLSVTAGAIYYSDILPGFRGAWFDALTTAAASASVLQILGDITIECLFVFDAGTNGNPWISHGAFGETEATNIIYEAQIEAERTVTWFSEQGAGVNQTYAWTTNSLPPVHQIFHLAHRRASGVVTNLVNGLQLGEASTAMVPTGGSSGSLVVGGSSIGGAISAQKFLSSLKISNRALTDAEILADYNYTLGGAYGYADQFGGA